MKYWYVVYMVIGNSGYCTDYITYGSSPAAYDLPYLPIRRVRAAILNRYPKNRQVIILNFKEICKESFDELCQS
jgi:hypothetical protein